MDTLSNPWLSRYAKFCVFALLVLITLGAFVTTYDAGMAVPTWPTINGDMNPAGWWKDHAVLLEHTHRLWAISSGVFIGILCAWVWGNIWAVGVAMGVSGICAGIAPLLHLEGNAAMQLRIWPAAIAFVVFLIVARRRAGEKIGAVHRLALALFFCVCIQAVMGGYRVTLETAGNVAAQAASAEEALAKTGPPAEAESHRANAAKLGAQANELHPFATDLRVVHGFFAQFTLLLLVILATLLSPISKKLRDAPSLAGARKLHGMAIGLLALYFIQLLLGAYIRHYNIGLAISTWPGGWPAQWTEPLTIHFLHSRVLPFLIFGHVASMAISCAIRAKGQGRLVRPGFGVLILVLAQIAFGVIVVTQGGRFMKPHAANSHVVNGALIMCTAALLAVRTKLLAPRKTEATV